MYEYFASEQFKILKPYVYPRVCKVNSLDSSHLLWDLVIHKGHRHLPAG